MELQQEPTIAEATTLKELNIHLGYIREKMNNNNEERKVDMTEIKSRLKEVADNQINRGEFEDLKKEVGTNTSSIKVLTSFKDSLTGKMVAYGSIASVIGGGLGIIISHYWK